MNPLRDRGGLRAGLRFALQRILRHTPRRLVSAAICFVFIYCLGTVSSLLFGVSFEVFLPWVGRLDPAITRSTEDIRVVVFGSRDIMGSATPESDTSNQSWTLRLCKELGCTSYRSLVPAANLTPAIVSNSLYNTAIEEFLWSVDGADLLESPASDYGFLKSQYPVPSGTPDLKAQVEMFLSLPPETKQPRSTLWIFTFGTWEVWNLASLPTVTAHDLLDSMVESIFQYAELLYLESLNPKSIAFSHFWGDIHPADVQTLTSPNAHRKIDERALETFRILIPKLFDITLVPIWQSRAVPPYPHTRAEHLRNAIALTQRWNEQVEKQMEMWRKKARYKPKRLEDERQSGDQMATRDFSAAMSEAGIPKSAPYPKRMGAQLTATVDGIIETMMHAEMKHSGSYDSAGNGMQPANASMAFTNVWAPCVAGAMDIPEGEEMGLAKTPCEAPEEYLFYDEATFGQRAVDHIVARAAKAVLNTLFPRARQAK